MQRRKLLFASCSTLVLILLLTVFFTSVVSAHADTKNPATNSAHHHDKDCRTSIPLSDWSPIGKAWHLTITFLKGSRQGQTEISDMTFLPEGKLTATFPGPTPNSPPTLPPTHDGQWCMVGPNVFTYHFKEAISVNGQVVVYIQTRINADLTSNSTYEAGGVGVGYSAATGKVLPGQYNVTQTAAVRS